MNKRVTIELPAEIARAVIAAAESGAEIALTGDGRELGTVTATAPAPAQHAPLEIPPAPDAAEMERRREAIERMRARSDAMGASVTTDEILAWIREGRR